MQLRAAPQRVAQRLRPRRRTQDRRTSGRRIPQGRRSTTLADQRRPPWGSSLGYYRVAEGIAGPCQPRPRDADKLARDRGRWPGLSTTLSSGNRSFQAIPSGGDISPGCFSSIRLEKRGWRVCHYRGAGAVGPGSAGWVCYGCTYVRLIVPSHPGHEHRPPARRPSAPETKTPPSKPTRRMTGKSFQRGG